MDATASPAALTVDALVVAATSPINATLNIDSIGDAGDNDIMGVAGVAANVVITGGTHLTFGSAASPYGFSARYYRRQRGYRRCNNVVEPGRNKPHYPTPLDTFIGGTGTNIVNLTPGAFAGNLIDFSKGGTDTVSFTEARYAGDGLLTNNPPASTELYNSVLGFDANPNNLIDIHNSGFLTLLGAVFNTNGTGPVAAGAAIETLDYTTGTLVNASTVPDNFIDIMTPVNTVPGVTTASSGFALAMGFGVITVGGGAHPFLMSYYDVQDHEAVLGSVESSAGGFITAAQAASVNVVGLIHMSEAELRHVCLPPGLRLDALCGLATPPSSEGGFFFLRAATAQSERIGRGMESNVILVDRITNVTVTNGIMRVECASMVAGGPDKPSGTVLIPVLVARQVVQVLVNSMQELEKKAREAMAASGATSGIVPTDKLT